MKTRSSAAAMRMIQRARAATPWQTREMPLFAVQRSWTTRLAMAAMFVANGIAFGAWAGNLPRFREAAGLNDAELGVVLLAVSAGAVIAMPLAGRYAARIGTGRACLGCAGLLAVSLPLPALAPGWLPVLASGMLLGLALGGLDVCMNALAAEIERGWGAAIMSSFHAGWSMGEMAGAASAGLLARAAVGLAPSLVIAGVGILCAGIAASRLRRIAPPPAERFAMPSRAMLGVCAMAALSFAVEGGTADWSGVYLRTVLGAPDALAATSLTSFAAVMVVCRLWGDFVVRRLGPVRVLQLGGVLAAIGLAAAVATSGVVGAIFSFALVGMGVANIVPVVITSAGGRGPAGVAMVATAGYATAMGVPPLIGFVSNEIGLRAAFLMLVAGSAAIAFLASAAAPPRAAGRSNDSFASARPSGG